jgi:hypothetical protein
MIVMNQDDDNGPLQAAITEAANAKNIVIFTGAGMSADSGIGTFRGQGGAWSGVFGTLALIYGGTSWTALSIIAERCTYWPGLIYHYNHAFVFGIL